MERKLNDGRIEIYESETRGRCRYCKRDIIRVNGSNQTLNKDKTRYRYPNNMSSWCIFRCKCDAVISCSFIEGNTKMDEIERRNKS